MAALPLGLDLPVGRATGNQMSATRRCRPRHAVIRRHVHCSQDTGSTYYEQSGSVPQAQGGVCPRIARRAIAPVSRSLVVASSSALSATHASLPPLLRSVRLRIVVLVALALLVCNADRVIMSVAVVPLGQQLGWTPATIGLVHSSFLWGYALTPTVGGALADRFGGHRVLGIGVLVWSLATLFTPVAVHMSLPLLFATRALMGVGEGVALPCMNNLLARWVAKGERSRAVGACMAGFHVGSMSGLLAAPPLLAWGGAPGPFIVCGTVGVLWALVWAFAATSHPSEHKSITQAEVDYVTQGKSPSTEPGGGKGLGMPPFGLLLSKKATWSVMIANFVNNWGIFILQAWMPVYLKQAVGVDLKAAAWLSALPWLSMAITGFFAGAIADGLLQKGWNTTKVRKVMQCLGFMGPCLALLYLNLAAASLTPLTAIVALMFALGTNSFSQAGFLVNFQEIGPRYAGVLHGMSNTLGTVAGIVGTALTGYG